MNSSAVDMASVQRVLIIKLSALGDIIHALPVSSAIKKAFPHVELTWAVEEGFEPLLIGNPYLSHILSLPKINARLLRSPAFHREYFQRLRDVRSHRFDLTLDLQGLTKSALLAAASGARVRLGYHWLREASTIFERPIPRREESIHIVDQYLDVARFLGAPVEKVDFPFHIPESDKVKVSEMLSNGGIDSSTPFISINPASALAIKQWSAEKYGTLIDCMKGRLGISTVLVTADKIVAGHVAASAKSPFVNLVGRTNLKQLARVLQLSALHICGDTGSAHLAAALGCPVIALIGPTDADRTCPYGQREHVIRRNELCGNSCNSHHCQFPIPRCLNAIQIDDVFSEAQRTLEKSKG